MNQKKQINHFYNNLVFKLSEKNKSCALATVTAVVGSTPQIPGCSALFGKKGLLAGTVGGGETELSVTKAATKLIRSKKSGYFRFSLNHEIGDNQGPICGGGMNILVDANPEIHLPVFEAVNTALRQRKPGVLLTFLTQSEAATTITRDWLTGENWPEKSAGLPELLKEIVAAKLANPVAGDFKEIPLSEPREKENRLVFVETILPPSLLIVAGAGHVGKALTLTGNWLGFEVAVWDDRPDFATFKNLPEAHHVFSGDIAQMKKTLPPGKDTFVVIVTRGHTKDAEFLKEFINEDVAYIGMMGSKRKVIQVRRLFLDNGWATEEKWNCVHTPIGIEIGSKTVNEIAISIAAQLIQEKNRK
mgnify:FL=1